jgi:hypothetical protein
MARTKKTQKEPEIIQNGDSLEMELQNLIIEAQKPVSVGSEEMKNKLFAFLSDWDSLNVVGSKQAQMLHYSVRQRLSNAIGAAFGHVAVAQYEREKANKLKS